MKLKKFIGYLSPSLRDSQKCESCGDNFVCGVSLMGCWCSKMKLSKQTLDELKSQYKHCLCPNCLEKLALSSK
ncbi:MAG: cysteine-rich CWC family protein [Acidobacteria bacterium]|nr:cysteine-rich CWC family protein [Acidobacteriota bacterium]